MNPQDVFGHLIWIGAFTKQFARQITAFLNNLVIKSVIIPCESLGDPAVAIQRVNQ